VASPDFREKPKTKKEELRTEGETLRVFLVSKGWLIEEQDLEVRTMVANFLEKRVVAQWKAQRSHFKNEIRRWVLASIVELTIKPTVDFFKMMTADEGRLKGIFKKFWAVGHAEESSVHNLVWGGALLGTVLAQLKAEGVFR